MTPRPELALRPPSQLFFVFVQELLIIVYVSGTKKNELPLQ